MKPSCRSACPTLLSRALPQSLLIALAAALLRPDAARAQPVAPFDGPRILRGEWRLHAGDDPAFADPNLDDSGWRIVPPDTPWRALTDPPAHRAWVRRRVAVPRDQALAVGFERVRDAAEIYVDGRLVARHGDPARGSGGLAAPFVAAVPPDASVDGEWLVAVRVWAGVDPRTDGMVPGLLVGPAKTLPDHVGRTLLGRWLDAEGFPALVLGLFLLGMGTLHASIALTRREPEQGLFAAAALCLGLHRAWKAAIFVALVAPTWHYTLASPLLRAFAYSAAILFGTIFARFPWPWIPRAAVGGMLAIGVIAAFQLVPWWGRALVVTQGIMAIVGTGLLVFALRYRVPGAIALGIGFLPLLAWGVLDASASVVDIRSWYAPWRDYAVLVALGAVMTAVSYTLARRMITTLETLDRMWRASYRFVPMPFLNLLGRASITDVRRGDSVSLDSTVMFCDIRDFTARAESRPAEDTFRFINDFLAVMVPCIHDHGGFVSHFLGDGFLALFPAGAAEPVAAAVAMQRSLSGFNAVLVADGEPAVHMGIGLHSGPVMLGTIGGGDRLDASVVSDVVNTASRIEGLTKVYDAPIVLSAATRALVPNDAFDCAELDAVVVKGRRQPLAVYEVLDGEPDTAVRDAKRAQRAAYAAALAAFRRGALDEARRGFGALAPRPAAALFVERCAWFERNGLPASWNGAWEMTLK
ncbi:MAG: hypothetical protein IT332_15420 [Ardenticatenales bacterium]|nr:hypothetical protein [Ardenticatenales bacterium]